MDNSIGRRKYLIFILIVLNCSISFADGIQKGFERLRIYDYFAAKSYFEKELRKKTAGAAYGLSIIYSTGNNPFYHLDSARVYILIADSMINIAGDKLKESYAESGITVSAIAAQKDTVCQKAFERASHAFTVADINHYMKKFRFCGRHQEATKLRNKAAFRDAKEINSSNAYQEFILVYPDAEDHDEARLLYEERLFEEMTLNKSIESYKQYLLRYPEGAYKQEAEKMIFQLSTIGKTPEEYDAFVKRYPGSYYANEAWRNLYKISFRDFTEENYRAFLNAYPDYPFMEELKEDYKLMNSQLLPIQKNGLWGYINEEGKEIIKPAYEENALFHEGLAMIKQNGKYGFINKSAKIIIPCRYDEAESFRNKTAVVALNGKYGLINQMGDVLIPFEYDDLSDPVEEICIGLLDEYSGYVSRSGKKITEFVYDFAGEFCDGFAVVGKDEKYGLIRKNGVISIKLQYDQLLPVKRNLYRARLINKWGLVNELGGVIVPFIYSRISDFSEGYALVAKGGKCGFINEVGKIIIPLNYVFSESMMTTAIFKSNTVLVKQKTRSVLLDSAGNKILYANFEDTGLPGNGLVPVKKSKKWGYASINGKLKIPCKYQEASAFEFGFAKIRMKNLYGIIDSTGKAVLPPVFEEIFIRPFCFITRENGLFGIQSFSGIMILPREFDTINILSDKTAEAVKGDKKTYINLITGKIFYREN